MSTLPLVSAIIIFLNSEAYIEEAITSVLAQTYPNWELLLVDDGSSDKSTLIAKRYASEYSDHIHYFEHENHKNRGMSATRNLGILQARGDYIAFLDSDDVWLPTKFEKQVSILEQYPYVGMVASPTLYWYSWDKAASDKITDKYREIGVESNCIYDPPSLLTSLLLNEANAPATCGVLIRRDVFETVGLFEPSFRGLFEDRVFFSKVYYRIPVFIMDECLDKYRQHSDSACHVEWKNGNYNPCKRSATHYEYLKWVKKYLISESANDSLVWEALNESILPYKNLPLHYLLQIAKRTRILR